VTRPVTVDLDDPSDVDRVWHVVAERHRARHADPELRASIVRRLAELAGRITPAAAAEIRAALDELLPAVVLDAHRDVLIDNRPALGAFPRARFRPSRSSEDWLREDPRRLAGLLQEALRFGHDVRRTVESVVDLAERLGIAEDVYLPILREAARQVPVRRSRATV
jgi:hypothetical protein